MAEFNLAEMLRDVNAQNLGQEGREQVVYVPFEKIRPDPDNGYSMDGILELARNIELVGLRDPLWLYPTEEGEYTVNSGHRRLAAISLLIEDGSDMFDSGVPSFIDHSDDSKTVREFKLIMSNMDNRKMTDADLSRQIERLQDVCRRLEAEGYKITGRARDWVAELAGVSKTKVGVLQAIRKNLDPQLLEKYDKGKINTSVANELQKLPRDFQLRIVKATEKGYGLTYYSVQRAREWYEQGKRWNPCLTCPDGKSCKRGDTFLRHDLEDTSSACFGEMCCLECKKGTRTDWPCDRRCSKAEAVRKDDRDKTKAAEEARHNKAVDKAKKATMNSAARIAKALDAAGVLEDEKINISPYYYGGSWTAGEIRKMSNGIFSESFNFTDDPLRADRLKDKIFELCETLKCSADYLLGRSDELNPSGSAAPVWWDLDTDPLPNEGDEAIVVYRMMRSAPTSAKIAVYRDGCFCDREYGMSIAGILRWQPYHDTDNNVPDSGTEEREENNG